MPLSFGIPLGLAMVVLGSILFFTTRNKKTAKVFIGIGIAVAILTFILIVLAANSQSSV